MINNIEKVNNLNIHVRIPTNTRHFQRAEFQGIKYRFPWLQCPEIAHVVGGKREMRHPLNMY
jgi:hypothetical protein